MFRCSILPLRLETGRFVGEPEYQRICKMCDSGQVENELHFLVECQFYNELRNQLLSGLNATVLNLNNSEKLKTIIVGISKKNSSILGTVIIKT